MRFSFLGFALYLVPTLIHGQARLDIDPVVQDTPVWCWVAAGEMIFRHYEIPNLNPVGIYQCGIIGALAGPSSPCFGNCELCNVPAGSTANIARMIREYPRAVRQLTRRNTRLLRVVSVSHPLTREEIRDEIDAERPIIAGVNPSGVAIPGQAQHAVLIVGYDGEGDDFTLTINDPYPYMRSDPYTSAGGTGGQGQYEIIYAAFRRSLRWTVSLYNIE